MKRSEMIESMSNWWKEHDDSGPEFYDADIEELERKMSKLLALIEYKGMKPPVLSIDPVLYTTKHIWEREDAI